MWKKCRPKSTRAPTAGSPSTRTCASSQVPAAGPGDHDGERGVGAQPRIPCRPGWREGQRAAGGVAQVEDGVDDVGPVRAAGVLEVGQPDLGAGVERVDGHLGRGGRPGHLDPAVLQGGRRGRDLPVAARGCPRSPGGSRAAGPRAASARRTRRAASSSSRRPANAWCSFSTKASAARGEDLLGTVDRMRVSQLERHRFLPECGC